MAERGDDEDIYVFPLSSKYSSGNPMTTLLTFYRAILHSRLVLGYASPRIVRKALAERLPLVLGVLSMAVGLSIPLLELFSLPIIFLTRLLISVKICPYSVLCQTDCTTISGYQPTLLRSPYLPRTRPLQVLVLYFPSSCIASHMNMALEHIQSIVC